MTERDAPSRSWVLLLQRLAGQVAHEIKNPLNAVAVNLEVVRSRAERERLESAAILPYARAAAQELERTSRLVEALLAITRSARPDVNAIAAPIVTLYDALAVAEGGRVTLDPSEGDTGIDLAADDARVAIATTLEAMVGPNVAIRLEIEAGAEIAARFTGPAVTPSMPPGVRCAAAPHGLTLYFPARAGGIESA
jgi:signal transduction histidine kinase